MDTSFNPIRNTSSYANDDMYLILYYYMADVTSGEMETSDRLKRIFGGPLLFRNRPALSRNGPALPTIHYEMKSR